MSLFMFIFNHFFSNKKNILRLIRLYSTQWNGDNPSKIVKPIKLNLTTQYDLVNLEY